VAIGWLDVELRHLATFRALATEKSFRATARRLGFAQSGISRHISLLEQRVGAKLVIRGARATPIELTDAGRILLEHAEEILTVVGAAERDFADRARGRPTSIRIGTFQTVSATLLAQAIATARGEIPDLAVELVETVAPLVQLRAGEVDLAFSETAPSSDDRVQYVELLQDPYLLVSQSSDEPAAENVVSLAELMKLPLLTYRTSCHLTEVERELARQGIHLRPVLRSDDALTLQSLVEAGTGCALLPALAVSPTRDSLRVRAVDPAIRPRTICLIWNAAPKPNGRLQTLIDATRSAAEIRSSSCRRSGALRSRAAAPQH
jgi:DNA-binding transcriptional LysR family regulator